ncbi:MULTISPECIES: LPS assembly lipoprotein LptE [unclassified Undibacterium]|uniref:LPS-assembly lipoprotein LptE n=1 Tax=unclassified Undibacterium TaxID=2630295 RepID=UPI002AC964A9|nr:MULTISPECIES: LPS assembly lipoprotein LptE [unclassified Undibacterium]MEB0137924.1 LPS assembly lipoprotein LptE [Undibacterium sp. CCC2.1]MEB0172044.1 LPS assembly lipoprotein LptE [Undibacterium sp. CCC1.1]MEB0174932.1 LPS assembly lipoprotein LptE [Undibacterium sp. CCC3.4]MEB0214860.1 LPS assembly lipoprotein LptE [Undibacterium sp. 5I2]WPX45377.1 LPS assembly lipoprotein LptE [Undibacterium sp. CCC3.4]
MHPLFFLRRGWFVALLLAFSLSACGFALRGPVAFPFKSIYISLPIGSPLNGELHRQLRANGQTLVTADPKDAEVILDVLQEARDKQILSLNSQGRVREYSLLYNFSFRLRNAAGKEYLEPVKIQLKRTITYNESVVLAKESEEAALYRDMQSDLVQQIMRRLSVVKMDD